MRVQVLVATMNQQDHSLLKKMNIQTDAIICNQCEHNEIQEFVYNGNLVSWMSFSERGVGLNRNNALMRTEADIALFADDDMIYVNNYSDIVESAFKKLSDADVIIFDLKYPNEDRKPITRVKRLKRKQCMRFGAARFAIKVKSVHLNGISFNLCFGGGAQYSSGEDTLFLNDCLKKGLKIYSYPAVIAHLQDFRESTWFSGYNDKFFFDKGIVYCLLNRRFGWLFSIYHCFKHRKKYDEYGWMHAYRQMLCGIRYARNRRF